MTGLPTPTPEYDKLSVAVFSIPLTSAFIESLFSKMNYTQSKIRSNLKDSTMTTILHVQDAALSDPQQPLSGRVKLKVFLPHSLCDRMKMEQNVGLKVCDCFEGVRFHGEVRQVKFHEIYSQYMYMYHVVFSDNDKQDYWYFFRISKTQNLSIDRNIELYVSVLALYDEDTVSTVRVEIWKENIFFIFLSFCRTFFYFLFSFLWYF